MQAVLENRGMPVGNPQQLRNCCLENCGIAAHLHERLFSNITESYSADSLEASSQWQECIT